MNRSALEQPRRTARFWLSYDLGLQANYSPLYVWLDKAGAVECGDSAAAFLTGKTREQITRELIRAVGRQPGCLYLIGKNAAGKTAGGFILGGRKRAPWSGFAESTAEADEEE